MPTTLDPWPKIAPEAERAERAVRRSPADGDEVAALMHMMGIA